MSITAPLQHIGVNRVIRAGRRARVAMLRQRCDEARAARRTCVTETFRRARRRSTHDRKPEAGARAVVFAAVEAPENALALFAGCLRRRLRRRFRIRAAVAREAMRTSCARSESRSRPGCEPARASAVRRRRRSRSPRRFERDAAPGRHRREIARAASRRPRRGRSGSHCSTPGARIARQGEQSADDCRRIERACARSLERARLSGDAPARAACATVGSR